MQALAQMWGRSGTDFAAAQQNMFAGVRADGSFPVAGIGIGQRGFHQAVEIGARNIAVDHAVDAAGETA